MLAAPLIPVQPDESIASMTLVEDGNFFDDNFTRPNSGVLGNSWVEAGAGRDAYRIENFQIRTSENTRGDAFHTHSLSPNSNDVIIQSNFRMGSDLAGTGLLGVRLESPTQINGPAEAIWSGIGNIYTLRVAGVGKNFAQTIPNLSRANFRMVVEDSGSFTFARLYQFFSPALSMSDATHDVTLVGEHSGAIVSATTQSAIGLSEKPENLQDTFFICGRNVMITGLSGDHQARILGPAATQSFVTQNNGTASINVDTYAIPMTTLEIADRCGNTLALITPTKGLWGGDTYSASVI